MCCYSIQGHIVTHLCHVGRQLRNLNIAARSISDLITVDGYINLDFNDVNTTLRNGGVAIISSGYGEGEHRVTKAIEDALNSPLLKNRDVYGSQKILMNFYFSSKAQNEFKMSEIDEMRRFRRCHRVLPALLIIGMASMITFQALFHMAINTGVFPVSGQPLPLVSMGGSSIIVMSVAFGIMLSVSRTIANYGNKKNKVEETPIIEGLDAENPTEIPAKNVWR